jgi:amino acid transporter
VPRAVISALVLSLVLSVALEVVFLGTVRVGGAGWSGINLSSPFAQIADTLDLSWFSRVLYADSIFSPSGSALVFTAETSREVCSLSRNRFLPEWFAQVHGHSGVPRRALGANFLLGLVFLLTLRSWEKLIAATSILGLFAYSISAISISAISVAGFARAEPERSAGWVRGSRILAPLGFVLATLIFSSPGRGIRWSSRSSGLWRMWLVSSVRSLTSGNTPRPNSNPNSRPRFPDPRTPTSD